MKLPYKLSYGIKPKKIIIDRKPFQVYEDSDLDDEICPNLIHRFGLYVLIGLCIAVAVVTVGVILTGKFLEL
jgi:hypothetical protein